MSTVLSLAVFFTGIGLILRYGMGKGGEKATDKPETDREKDAIWRMAARESRD